jgi:hypothetical protein
MVRLQGYIARGVKQDKLSFEGPPKTREQQFELTRSQILHMNSKLVGLPIMIEHNSSGKATPIAVGKVIEGRYNAELGDWEVDFELDTEKDVIARDTYDAMKVAGFRSLSLCHDPNTMTPQEVSIVIAPARPGCDIKQLSPGTYNVGVAGDSLVEASKTPMQQPTAPQQQQQQQMQQQQQQQQMPVPALPSTGEQTRRQINAQTTDAFPPAKPETPSVAAQSDAMDVDSTPQPDEGRYLDSLKTLKQMHEKGKVTHSEGAKLMDGLTGAAVLAMKNKKLEAQLAEMEKQMSLMERDKNTRTNNWMNILSAVAASALPGGKHAPAEIEQEARDFMTNNPASKGFFDLKLMHGLVEASQKSIGPNAHAAVVNHFATREEQLKKNMGSEMDKRIQELEAMYIGQTRQGNTRATTEPWQNTNGARPSSSWQPAYSPPHESRHAYEHKSSPLGLQFGFQQQQSNGFSQPSYQQPLPVVEGSRMSSDANMSSSSNNNNGNVLTGEMLLAQFREHMPPTGFDPGTTVSMGEFQPEQKSRKRRNLGPLA